MHKSARVDHRATGSSGFPRANGLRLTSCSPRGNQLLAPVVLGLTMHGPGRAGCISQNLTPARGVRSTRLHRPRPSPLNAPPGLAARQSSGEDGWQRRSSRAGPSLTVKPPCDPLRARRCRVHRIPPHVSDDHDTPLFRAGMGRSSKGDLPDGSTGIYSAKGVRQRKLVCPTGNF